VIRNERSHERNIIDKSDNILPYCPKKYPHKSWLDRFNLSRTILLVLGLLLILIIPSIPGLISSPNQTNSGESSLLSARQYIKHDPIFIEGNDDFHTQAVSEGWDLGGSRDGTAAKPYVITGISITSLFDFNLIVIRNTDVYFQITSSQFSAGKKAMELFKVENGFIFNNTFYNQSETAIHLFASTHNTISNNSILGEFTEYPPHLGHIRRGKKLGLSQTVYGILLDDSSSNLISNNKIEQLEYGIGTDRISNYNIISNNTISKCSYAGYAPYHLWFHKFLKTNSENSHNILSFNSFTNNQWGIGLRGTNNTVWNNIVSGSHIGIVLGLYEYLDWIPNWLDVNSTISHNVISNNPIGIKVDYSMNSTLLNNTIELSSSYGIVIESYSSNTVVKWNDFIDNDGQTSQAYDNGSGNTFAYNYWNEWISPDIDGDGIVDNPYSINGGAGTTDPYPMVPPNNPKETATTSSVSLDWILIILFLSITTVIVRRRTKKHTR
jgi:parallel beta-helix repeat protein